MIHPSWSAFKTYAGENPRFRFEVFSMFLGAMVAACSGESDCLEESRTIGGDEATALNMTAQQALAAVALQGSRPLSWYATSGTLDFAGKGTQSILNWVVTPNLVSARFVESKINPKNTNGNVKECFDRIEIDANSDMSSDDQWLNERALPVVIQFVAEDNEAPQGARWQTPQSEIPLEALMGHLPEGLSGNEAAPQGENHFEVEGWSGFDASEWIQIYATTTVRKNNSVSYGETELGCVSTEEERCEEPR